MTRVHLAIGLVALFALSYGAIERASVSVVDREAMATASQMAWAARAEAEAAWARTLDRRRGLVRNAARSLGDEPDASELRRTVEVLGGRLGGASAILDREGRSLVQAGDPKVDFTKADMSRSPGPTDALARLELEPEPQLVITAQTGAGLVVAHVQPISSPLLQSWLGTEGGGRARIALVGREGKLRVVSGGGLAGELDSHGLVVQGEDVYASSLGEIHDDLGVAGSIAGLGHKDREPGRRVSGVVRVSMLALGGATLVLMFVVLGVVHSFDVKERLYVEAAQKAEEVPRWRKVGSSSEPPGPSPSTPPGSVDVREPHFEGTDTAPAAGLAAEPHDEPETAIEAEPPGTEDEDAEGGAAPWSDRSEDVPPLAHAPEYASEITPYSDPLNPSSIPSHRPGVTTGYGFSPRPSRPPPSMPPVSASMSPYSMPPITSVAPGSGFSSGFGSGVPRPSQPVASASPITQQPHLRSSMPPPHVQPFDVEHYRQVYNEFVGHKRRLGESVEKITLEGFSAKLRRSEEQLLQKHGCRAVRFQVIVRSGQVSLRPQLVR